MTPGIAQEDPVPERVDAPLQADEPAGAPATVAFERRGADELRVVLGGAWRLGAPRPEIEAFERELDAFLGREPGANPARRVVFVAQDLASWDTALLAWLRAVVQACASRSIEVDRAGLPSGALELLELSERVIERPQRDEAPARTLLGRIGWHAERAAEGAVDALGFLGQVALSLKRFVTMRAQYRRSDLWAHMQAAGAEAVPIVTLLSVIVGLILAFVGAVQLRLFGADLYVANLVGIAMVREMGAMVVGITLAGRTGAAYAAQLGTMKVTEEIDALTTFGISSVDFLVVPRVVALFLMTPFLCLYSIVLGCLGGAMVGVWMLGLSSQLYFDQTLRALEHGDLYGGIFRGAVYGLLVGLTGCLRGLNCGNDAAAVGQATTSAVVSALVAIVVADGIIAVVFNALGI